MNFVKHDDDDQPYGGVFSAVHFSTANNFKTIARSRGGGSIGQIQSPIKKLQENAKNNCLRPRSDLNPLVENIDRATRVIDKRAAKPH